MAVIDASVYVAALHRDESAHAACRTWLARAATEGQLLSAPAILPAEVVAAIRRRVGNPRRALQVTDQLFSSGLIALHPVTVLLAERAAHLAAEHGLRGCDAVYVALAEQLNEHLVTLDAEQLARAAAIVTTERP